MAKEDVVAYENLIRKKEAIMKGLREIYPILKDNKDLRDYLGVKWYTIEDGYAHELNRVMDPQIETAIKQMNCAHITTKEELSGWDSHKDYYEEVCTACKKVIKEW